MTVNKFKEEVCTKCTHPCNCDDIVNVKSCQDFIDTKIKVFTDNKTKVIAIGSYKGKSIKCVAKCDPEDVFNFNLGKELAVARCNAEIAWRRRQDARTCVENTNAMLDEARRLSEKAYCFFEDADDIYTKALYKVRCASKNVK